MDDLYIFLHIPKCAGNTIMKKLFQDVSSKEICVPGYYPEGPDEPSDKFFGEERMKMAIDRWARWNDPEKIRFISSHHVYYGIHKLFPQKNPHYVAFLRHPINMIVSYYNYGCGIPKSRYLSRTIYRGAIEPNPFTYWAKNNPYYSKEFLINFLQDRGFSTTPESFYEEMFCIGFVDTFKEDFDNLCDFMQLPKGFSNQNVTANKKVHLTDKIIEQLHPDNMKSINFYFDLKGLCNGSKND